MSKTIRESLGPVHERNAATIVNEATPQFEVKYSSSKRGPIKVTKFMTQDEAQAFLKKIRGEGMNGIVSKGGKPVRTPMKEDAKSERLAKIARAAAAREKDQAKQKEAAKQKHYAASAKSRESVKHFGNKDQFGRVREDVEQIDEISVKKKAQAYRKMRDRQADVSYNPHTGKSDMLADTPEKKRANRMLKRIGDKHGKDVKRAVYKSQYEEVEQTDESLRQRADDAMTFSNRQAAFSTAFKKKHGRAPTKQELRDAGVGKGGDNPAGAKAYQKAMSKLRPASRSGIKDKFVHSEEVEQVDEAAPKASAKMMANTQSQKKLRARIEKNKRTENEIESRKQLRNRIIKKKTNEDVEQVDEGRRRGMIDDEGYRRDSRGREYNPVDDRIRARNAARHRAEAEAKRKKAEAERKKKEKTNESVGITEDDKAEYNKLMDKYGDMPMSKVPMKARLRIRELGRSVRGDKGGPTAGDLVKSMKRRRMGEEVEQVDEAVDGWIAMYNGKKVEIKKSEAKDLYAAKLKAIQMLKVPKSKQGLLAIKPAVNEEVEQVGESEYGSIGDRVKRKLRKPGGLADRHDNRVARKSSSPEKRDGAVQRMADRRGKRGPMDHDSSKWHSDEKLRAKVRKSAGVNEEVEQVDESLGNFMADYGGKEMKVRAKDEEDARSRVGRWLKIPKSKQYKIVVWEPMTDAERRDFELDDDGEREYANRYGHDMARKADRLKQRAKKRAGRRKQRNEEVEQFDEVKYGGLLHKVRKGGKPGGLRDKIDQGYSLRSPETFFDPKEMSKSDVGRAQRMVDRRPSLKGKGPIDDPDNYALKSGGVDMAGIYYDKGDKSGSAKLARQLRKERSRKRSRKQRNEEVEVAEGGMIGRTKPSRELNVQKDEKPHLAGVKSLKYQKRAAHKAERKKGKQDIKKGD